MRKRDLQTLDEILESRGGFGHREHVELAWMYLRRYPTDKAAKVMVAAIRRIARQHEADDKYHETITHAWLRFVAVHIQRWGAESLEEFIDRNRDVLDPKLIEHFYSRELILSESARAAWVGPTSACCRRSWQPRQSRTDTPGPTQTTPSPPAIPSCSRSSGATSRRGRGTVRKTGPRRVAPSCAAGFGARIVGSYPRRKCCEDVLWNARHSTS